MEATREVWTIASQEFRRTTRTARVAVFLLLYVLFMGIVVTGVHLTKRLFDARIDEQVARGTDRAEIDAQLEKVRQEELEGRFGDKELVSSFKNVPLGILSIFSISLFWLPIYIMLLGFDQVSGELGPRSIRYITVRARRGSILVGKFLGQALLLVGMLVVVQALVFVYSQVAYTDFKFAEAAVTFARWGIASITFSLAWLALSTLSSTLFRTPVVSLVGNFIFLMLFLTVHFAGYLATGSDAPWRKTLAGLRYATPTFYFTDLLHPLPSHYGVSILAYAGFAIAFLSAAWVILRARDL